MRSSLRTAFSLFAVAGLIAACSKKQESVPNPAPAAVQVEAAQVPAAKPAPTPPAPAVNYVGSWVGESGPDLPISFTIEGNQVTSLSASYHGKSGSCSYNGQISSEGPAAIVDKSFSTKGKSTLGEEVLFTATGTLISATEASGTLSWKGKSNLCGDFQLEYKWTAKKEAAEPAEPAELE